jgi:hypothetical protein
VTKVVGVFVRFRAPLPVDQVRIPPQTGKPVYCIFVFGRFNAFLKNRTALKHAIFIFIYDRKHEIIPTINFISMSIFDFKQITVKMPRHRAVVQRSKNYNEDDAAYYRSKKADGAMRDLYRFFRWFLLCLT